MHSLLVSFSSGIEAFRDEERVSVNLERAVSNFRNSKENTSAPELRCIIHDLIFTSFYFDGGSFARWLFWNSRRVSSSNNAGNRENCFCSDHSSDLAYKEKRKSHVSALDAPEKGFRVSY
ncbi:hypothetical protein RF11_06406 [Thelohanellus kitauei]|uniref:Uncharacterized protein n=1 Tax=Thelohanellus kitauei TaxID=669202 RepID=A0A0C2NEY8_THEKT|nr:hypothetical protein RF11_06406 [Thelohanellus kitauei]